MDTEHPKPSESEKDTRAELSRLWLRCMPVLDVFLRSLVQDAEARDDIMQATGEQVSRTFEQYDRARPFNNWVIGIARYCMLAYFRDQKRDRLRFGSEAIDYISDASVKVSPEIEDRIEALEKCMERLNERQLKLIQMRYENDLKPMQIADRLGTSSNAISLHLRRIRLALAECIDKRLRRGESHA